MSDHSYAHPDDGLALRIVRLESQLLAAQQENARLREALRSIVDMPNRLTGGDWDEIEDARCIARAALRGGEAGHG